MKISTANNFLEQAFDALNKQYFERQKMSEKSTMLKELSVCKSVLSNRAEHYKHLILHNVETKEDAIANFTHDAYVILLIVGKLCDTTYLNNYIDLYNRLMKEIRGLKEN